MRSQVGSSGENVSDKKRGKIVERAKSGRNNAKRVSKLIYTGNASVINADEEIDGETRSYREFIDHVEYSFSIFYVGEDM